MAESKSYNVVNGYDWTVVPRDSSLRKKAPAVYATSYLINTNQIMQSIQGYINLFKTDPKTFYERMYQATKEDDFIFPYFDDSVRGFQNNFSETYSGGIAGNAGDMPGAELLGGAKTLADSMANLVSQGAAFFKGNPGSYLEVPKFYQYENTDEPLNVTFNLINTITEDEWKRNYELVTKLTDICRPHRKSAATIDPPRLFKVRVPGYRWMEWAYASSFNVKLKGTKRMIEGKIVPEAFEVNMTFTSLTIEVSNFLTQSL